MQQHFAFITGAGRAYRMIDSASASGQAFLFRRTFDHLAWSMSWPGLLIALAGVVYLLDSPTVSRSHSPCSCRRLSYYLTFIAVVGSLTTVS